MGIGVRAQIPKHGQQTLWFAIGDNAVKRLIANLE
jgi:hypothetical protein